MNADFIEALNALEKEKGISKDVLLSAVESALIFAYKRNYNSQGNVRAEIDGTTGEIHIYASKTVVEEVMDPTVEISLAAAKKVNALYEVGDVMEEEADTRKFGRIAAQTAKQVVVQRIREAERGNIYEEYAEKENEILTAIVQRVEKGNAYVELGKTDGILTPNEMIPGETYENSQRIKVYVLEVRKDNRGPQVVVSRTHPGLIKRLFEMEVPEIMSGVVQIKSIAREAGFRTKIAVFSTDPQVDAVGACVGQRGARVERICNEIAGEKIDIIEWDPEEVKGLLYRIRMGFVTFRIIESHYEFGYVPHAPVAHQTFYLVTLLSGNDTDACTTPDQFLQDLPGLRERFGRQVRIRLDDLHELIGVDIVQGGIADVLVEHLVHAETEGTLEERRGVSDTHRRKGPHEDGLDTGAGVEKGVVEIEQVQGVTSHFVPT